jgi:hypothetical protein
MATSLTDLLQQLLQNTTNVQVLRQLMTPDATYVSLNFDNPELKKVMPWTGTHSGPQSLPKVFEAIQRFWKTLDFKVTDTIEQGSRVAIFGSSPTNLMRPARKSPRHLVSWRVSRETRSRMSSFSRTAMARPGRSKRAAQRGSTAIPQDRRLRSNDGQCTD